MAKKGKKFRLPASSTQVISELEQALEQYVQWATYNRHDDVQFCEKLAAWAEAVVAKCTQHWRTAAAKEHTLPEGYPGLKGQIKEAHNQLVFLLDDRAPHGVVFVYKRWYQKKMAEYLADTSVF